MAPAVSSFLLSLGAVTLAEMGDKTQILAMCFATRFSAMKVLLGVFTATVLNHALAVVAGYLLSHAFSAHVAVIHVIASLSFIGFALWTIRGDKEDDSCDVKKQKFGPVLTVAIAFFLAEMGDKTQLTTVSLAAGLSNPVAVLIGTTMGMLVADGLGIMVGVIANKKIPEKLLKWISASIFAASGIIGYIEAGRNLMNIYMLIGTTLLIMLVAAELAYLIVKSQKPREASLENKHV